jgi:succinoglycan biosynthesis transport protein ExoP
MPNSDEWIDDDKRDDNRSGSAAGRRLLQDLLGRWYWIVLGMVLGGGVAVYYLSKAPKDYCASATLLLKEQTASVLGKDQTDEINLGSIEAMNTVAERLKRQELLEKVASREDVRSLEGIVPLPVRWLPAMASEWLGDKAADPVPAVAVRRTSAALAGAIGSWMTVAVRRGTRLLDITITHSSPEVAKVVADAICLEYLAETTGVRSNGRMHTIELLTEKSEEARKNLQSSQKAFSAYQRALIGHEELQTKEKEVVELKRRYRAKHPEMVNAVAQVEGLQLRFLADFDAAVKSGMDEAYWKESEASMDPTSKSLPERLEIARRMLLSRTAVLRSEIQSQESVFNMMLTKMQQVDVNQAEQDSEVEISNLSQLPGIPVSPVGSKIMMLGVLGGLAVGAFIGFIAVVLDNKFHTVIQVEELLSLPVLAAVSRIPARSISRKVTGDNQAETDALGREKDWDQKIVFRQGMANSSFAEMFRVLRASITLLGPEEKRKITLFTSAIPGEGKTLTSVNFALAAAAQGKKVLLIDLDLRRPTIHLVFGLTSSSNKAGLTGYLAGKVPLEEAIIHDVSGAGLDLLISGARAPNPGELLNAQRLFALMTAVRGIYDVIVLDTAPLLAVPDTRVVAAHADNVCLVVRAEYVSKGAAARVMQLLAAGRTPLAGVIFNGFRERKRLVGLNYSYGNYKYGYRGNAYGNGRDAYGSDAR